MSFLFFLKAHFQPLRGKEEYIQSAYAKKKPKRKAIKLPDEVVKYVNTARKEQDQEALAKKAILQLLEEQEQLAVEIQARVWDRIQKEQEARRAEQIQLAQLALRQAEEQALLDQLTEQLIKIRLRREREERDILALIHLDLI